MITVVWFALTSLILTGLAVATVIYIRRQTIIVPEDQNAVLSDQHGFITRVLPAGVHRPGLRREHVAFTFETKPRLTRGRADDVPTSEGISLQLQWSGIYACDPDLITDKRSQRLRALPMADKMLQRQVDLTLRRLVGDHTVQDMFRPSLRTRLERQVLSTIQPNLTAVGIRVMGIDLETVSLPNEVASAFNQAKAIQTLDAVLRQSDPATRSVITHAHEYEELLAWEKLFPPYGKYLLSHNETGDRIVA